MASPKISFNYTEKYEDQLLRGEDGEPRPWNIVKIITSHASLNFKYLLDIGCGTATKLIAMADKFAYLVGLEPINAMLVKAKANIHQAGITNIYLVGGVAQQVPFHDSSFDMITNLLAPYNFFEIQRLLKPGGKLIMETLGERDKDALKRHFGKVNGCYRGQLTDLPDNGVYDKLKNYFAKFFSTFEIRNGYWKTYYSREGLQFLLEQTPVVKGFNLEADKLIFDRVCELYSTPYGIETIQHRLLVIAEK